MIQRLALIPPTLAAVLLAPSTVAAHAERTSASPEDGAELDEPPTEVVVVFDGELDPGASGFVVTDADGTEVGSGEVDLEVAERNELRGAVAIEGSGTFTVAWTATAADGHREEGRFTFTVVGDDGDSDGDDTDGDATPDTAMVAPSFPFPATAGVVFVLLAAGLIVVRLTGCRQAER